MITTLTKDEELLAYWNAMRAAMKRHHAGRPADKQQDDVEVIAIHTDWPRLRKACTDGVAIISPQPVAVTCESSA